MELDELKQNWKDAHQQVKLPEREILSLILQPEHGPLAQLRRRFLKGMFLVPLIALVACSKLYRHTDGFSHAMFWFLIYFTITILAYFIASYLLVRRMNDAGSSDIYSHLQRRVRLLERLLHWRLLLMRGNMLLFLAGIELSIYFHKVSGLTDWASRPPGLRMLGYALMFSGFYLLTKFATDRRYRTHIKRLKELCDELA